MQVELTAAELTPLKLSAMNGSASPPFADFVDRVQTALDAVSATQADLARELRVTPAAVNHWMSGEVDPRRIKSDNMRRAALFLRLTPEYLMAGTGPRSYSGSGDPSARYDNASDAPPDLHVVPVISYVQAGVWTESSDPYPRGQGMERITVDSELAGSLSRLSFGLVIEGDSMISPGGDGFQPGDKVIIDPGAKPRPGDFVVAKLESAERATFKKYRDRGIDANGERVFELVPLNPDYPTLVVNSSNPGHIVGVMMEHRRGRRSR